jgi:NADPH2 dehydrogenase
MSKLFESMYVGGCQLQHRMVMAPLTRYRANDQWVPMDIAKGELCTKVSRLEHELTSLFLQEYYIQRSCVPGTLIISEAVQISPRFVGRDNAPGIWSPAQIAAWRDITDAVHAKGCFIWCQLWAQGRAAHPAVHRRLGYDYMSASPIPHTAGAEIPKEMTEEDISHAIEDYRVAARNAIAAGFDGVEVHGGNGYLPDQFLQDVSNKRTDQWGGESIENRCKFQLEVMKAICDEIGSQRAAVRLSPWSDFMGMGMDDPIPTFTYLVEQLRPLNLAFLDLIEARIRGNDDADCGIGQDVSFLVHAWCKDNETPVLLSGGFSADTAMATVDQRYKDYQVAIMFGRYWTSNPDLAFRLQKQVSLVKYDRLTFYTPKRAEGYIDWEFSEAYKANNNVSIAG